MRRRSHVQAMEIPAAARKRAENGETSAKRYANFAVKSRILLETKVGSYTICYRRLSHTNELVVNGRVYDEKKGVLEFEHALYAVIDGHKIEAGLDGDGYSYILFDGELVAFKERKF